MWTYVELQEVLTDIYTQQNNCFNLNMGIVYAILSIPLSIIKLVRRKFSIAQKYLEKFYSSFGFETESAAYMEDGMPHIQMTKKSF